MASLCISSVCAEDSAYLSLRSYLKTISGSLIIIICLGVSEVPPPFQEILNTKYRPNAHTAGSATPGVCELLQ